MGKALKYYNIHVTNCVIIEISEVLTSNTFHMHVGKLISHLISVHQNSFYSFAKVARQDPSNSISIY